MEVSPTKLRENLFALLDQVLETGVPLDVKRKGKLLHIIPDKQVSKLDRIEPKKISNVSDEALINTTWENEWKPFI